MGERGVPRGLGASSVCLVAECGRSTRVRPGSAGGKAPALRVRGGRVPRVFAPARGCAPHVALPALFLRGHSGPFLVWPQTGGLGPGLHRLAPRREGEAFGTAGSEVRGPAQVGKSGEARQVAPGCLRGRFWGSPPVEGGLGLWTGLEAMAFCSGAALRRAPPPRPPLRPDPPLSSALPEEGLAAPPPRVPAVIHRWPDKVF